MIEVRFEKKKRHLILRVNGHAGSAAKGHDLICAACSTLTYTLAQYLEVVKSQGLLKKSPEIVLEEGKAMLICKPKKKALPYIQEGFFVIQSGFALLAANNPDYITIYAD